VVTKKLERECTCKVIASFNSGITFLEQWNQLQADLIILDFELPHISGLETFHRFRKLAPEVPVLFLSMFQFNEYFEEACQHPFTAYVSKQSVNEICAHVKEMFTTGTVSRPTILSDSEKQLVLLICNENDNAGIAKLLNTSEETVKKRKQHLAHKLGINNHATAFLKWALRNGLYSIQSG
jgi:DNA-binding NarL/FixJ family response regulator